MSDETNVNAEPNATTNGGVQATWFDSLPDDMKGDESVAQWKDKSAADVVSAWKDASGKLSKAIVPPGEDAPAEERQAFEQAMRKALGVPEKVEDYKLTLPEGVPQDDPLLRVFVEAGHAQGLNSAQLQGVMDKFLASQHEYQEAVKQVRMDSLQKEWGNQFETKVALAVKGMEGAAKDSGVDPAELDALAKALPAYPTLAKIFAEIGKYYSEDKFQSGGHTIKEPERTPSGHPMLRYEDNFAKR